MADSAVRVEREAGVAELIWGAPRRNALSTAVIADLMSALRAEASEATRALILRAEPESGVWCAGHDVAELPRDGSDPLTWANPVEALFRAITTLPIPVIAAVDGSAWGAGCNLVMACDLVVATRASRFAITPTKMGVPYNTAGVAQFLGALPLNIAREMFFTADPVAAERLAQLGVVNRLVDTADDLVPAAWDLAKTIALRAPLAVRAIKAEVTALMSARALTSEEFEWLTSLRRAAWRSSDYVEGIAAFEERRSPDFQGR